jgi:hypothetical protein
MASRSGAPAASPSIKSAKYSATLGYPAVAARVSANFFTSSETLKVRVAIPKVYLSALSNSISFRDSLTAIRDATALFVSFAESGRYAF